MLTFADPNVNVNVRRIISLTIQFWYQHLRAAAYRTRLVFGTGPVTRATALNVPAEHPLRLRERADSSDG
eukprot:657813-Rhodomonas_salina.1